MTIGDGIFLSAVLLSVVGLFAVTKDRWNWRRIAKWGLLGPIAAFLLLNGGAYLYGYLKDRPTPQNKFGEISLTATPADILFLLGEPNLKDGPDRWIYYAGSVPAARDAAMYLVTFKNGRVRFVLYTASGEQISNPTLMGFDMGTSYERVLEKLGQPSNVSISENKLERMFSYEKFNVFFSFSQGRLVAYGIYQPTSGPMLLRSEAAASAPTK